MPATARTLGKYGLHHHHRRHHHHHHHHHHHLFIHPPIFRVAYAAHISEHLPTQ